MPLPFFSWWFWICVFVVVFFILWLFRSRIPSVNGGSSFHHVLQSILLPGQIGTPSRPEVEEKAKTPLSTIEELPPVRPLTAKPHLSRGEKLTCQALERIYRVPFSSARPDFLRNPETGKNLELDCYNAELQIAAEYNGVQHYRFPNPFHRTEEEFKKQVRRDMYKYEKCVENGIFLITVPYSIAYGKIQEYIWEKIREAEMDSFIEDSAEVKVSEQDEGEEDQDE